ncbi:MAG: alpha/beta hydrolase [Actinomycetota bacterium]
MTLHPQIVELLAAMERPDRPRIHELPIEAARQVYEAMPGFMGDLGHATPSEDRSIDGPHGPIPIRIYRAEGRDGGSRPLVVFAHGGGFCIGGLDSHDRECRAIAAQSGATIVAVDYRMGPEHAYGPGQTRPAWVDDAFAAFTWAADHAAELGADPDRMVVCGDSAGGNISAVLAQLARDESRPLALQVLIYPATDVRDEAMELYPSYAENADAPILERPVLDYFRDNSRTGGDNASPLMSPGLTDDLGGLAPALVVTAEHDPLRDDGEAYAERLRAAGVPVTLHRYDGMPHGFLSFGPVVDDAVKLVAEVADAIASI